MVTKQDKPQSQSIVNPSEFEEFFGDEYKSQSGNKRPWIQAMRGENPEQCGFFIPDASAELVSWAENFDPSQYWTEYLMASDEKLPGLLLKSPRMLVIPRTTVLARQYVNDEQGYSHAQYIGNYRKDQYGGNSEVKNVQAFDILLLSEKNKKLHDEPLSMVLSGAAQASFSIQFQKACEEFGKVFAKAMNRGYSKMGARFNCLYVFEPIIKREKAGTNATSPAFKVVDFVHTTPDNWFKKFVGADRQLKSFLLELAPRDYLLTAEQVKVLPSLSAAGMYEYWKQQHEAQNQLSPASITENPTNVSNPADEDATGFYDIGSIKTALNQHHQQQPGVTFPARQISIPSQDDYDPVPF